MLLRQVKVCLLEMLTVGQSSTAGASGSNPVDYAIALYVPFVPRTKQPDNISTYTLVSFIWTAAI